MSDRFPKLPHLAESLTALRRRCPEVNIWLTASRVDVPALHDRIRPAGLALPDGRVLTERQDDCAAWSADAPPGGVSLIAGCGLGAGLRQLLDQGPSDHRLVVLEPRPEILLACLGLNRLGPDIEAGRLGFVRPEPQGLESVRSVLMGAYSRQALVLRLDPFGQSLDAAGLPVCAVAAGRAKAFLNDLIVNHVTFRAMHDVGVENELTNLSQAVRHPSLLPLSGAATGVAALIVAAGPSAPDIFPYLADLRTKALLVCPLQALPIMQRSGVAPHLCVGMDTHVSMLRVYERLDQEYARRVPMIYNVGIQPDVLKRYPGPKLPVWLNGGVGTWLMSPQDLVLAAEGGNVSVVAAQLLLHLGVTRIGYAGLDLAWPDKRSHAPGHHANDGRSGEVVAEVTLPNRHGQPIQTTHVYRHAGRCLERVIASSDAVFLQACGGGLPIEGLIPTTAEDLAKRLDSELGRLDAFLERLHAPAEGERRRVRYDRDRTTWKSAFDAAATALERLGPHPDRAGLDRALLPLAAFIRANPVYLPVLGLAALSLESGEITSLGGFLRLREKMFARMTQMDAAFSVW